MCLIKGLAMGGHAYAYQLLCFCFLQHVENKKIKILVGIKKNAFVDVLS